MEGFRKYQLESNYFNSHRQILVCIASRLQLLNLNLAW